MPSYFKSKLGKAVIIKYVRSVRILQPCLAVSLRILKSTLLLNKVFLCLSNQKMSLLNVVGLLQHQSRKSNVLCFRAGQKVMK